MQLRETSASAPQFPSLAPPKDNYCGLPAVGAQSLFHTGSVCFPKQVSIVLKPWCRELREQIEVDPPQQAVTKAPRVHGTALGGQRGSLASAEGVHISKSVPPLWKAAQSNEAGALGLFLPFNSIILAPDILFLWKHFNGIEKTQV